jgi:hypothetical protein
MTAKAKAKKPSVERTAVDKFFEAVESRTEDPIHRRLLKAARKEEPGPALERELHRIIEELLNEA